MEDQAPSGTITFWAPEGGDATAEFDDYTDLFDFLATDLERYDPRTSAEPPPSPHPELGEDWKVHYSLSCRGTDRVTRNGTDRADVQGFPYCADCDEWDALNDKHLDCLKEAAGTVKKARRFIEDMGGAVCVLNRMGEKPDPEVHEYTTSMERIRAIHADNPKAYFWGVTAMPTATPAATVASVAPNPLYIDVAALLNGDIVPVLPTIGARTDGEAFIYAGAVNVIFGNPEAGKTLVASAIAADTLFAGGSVLWVDIDFNGAAATLLRFRSFGVSVAVLSDPSRFRLATPEDKDAILRIVKDAEQWAPTMAVIDSIGELLSLFGANPNSDEDYAPVNRAVPAKLARAGVAVLAIDHEAKGQASRDYGASGAVAKKRAVDGVMLRASVRVPFAPGHGGKSVLTVVKDRHGGVRKISPVGEKEPLAATFELLGGEATNWKFWAPDGAPQSTTRKEASDLDQLKALRPAPKSIYDVKLRMQWGGQRATDAFRMLSEAA